MNQVVKKVSLLAALSISLVLVACGGGGGGGGALGTAADYVSFNGTTYSANGSTVTVVGILDQTSYSLLYGGPTVWIGMDDTQSGTSLAFGLLTTVDGLPGTYNLMGLPAENAAYITDPTVLTGGNMQVSYGAANGTGGSITIQSSGEIGQPIAGNFNMNLCDTNAVCSASLKNYTGAFSINRAANYGSLAMPASVLIPVSAPAPYPGGILHATGKNYYTIPTDATGGTLTLTLAPTVDVNLAVFTDAGFTTPATCDVTSTLNVVGNGVETCAITVAANQIIYLTVSQTVAATALETYTLNVAEQ